MEDPSLPYTIQNFERHRELEVFVKDDDRVQHPMSYREANVRRQLLRACIK